VAEGIDIMASALRYLGIEHGHQAITGSPRFQCNK
jgi:hypothetical protein